MTSRRSRPTTLTRGLPGRVAGIAAVSAAGLLAIASSGAAAGERAHAAHTMSVKDEGHLKLVHSSGSLLIDEGPASGTIPGKTRVSFTYNGNPNVTAQIVIYGHSGRIYAHGGGRLSSPSSASPSFKGSLKITGGTGRYAHANGSGTLYGVFYRRSYGLVVQTEGSLHY
jgi:hypothetical protein